jgi:hypothetical protein
VALGIARIRVGEVLGMAADRLELDRRRVTMDQQLQRVDGVLVLTTPKSEKVRTIVVPTVVALVPAGARPGAGASSRGLFAD